MARYCVALIWLIAAPLVMCGRTGAASAAGPFPLAAYVGNPNGSDAGAEAAFQASYHSISVALGASPQLIVAYVDYTKPISQWPDNASWQAWSNAQSKVARGLVPVIGLPLASIAWGSPSSDQQLQEFANGWHDEEIRGVLHAWASHGFKHLIFRPGWEMNIQGPTYAGDARDGQAHWVSAFAHVYRILHAAANSAGLQIQVIWNPNVTNYTNAAATRDMYPGDAFVDIVGADIYSDIHPFSDGGNPATYHDWTNGAEVTSIWDFIVKPENRTHYWNFPAGTKWSNDGSNGHSQSLASLLNFALRHKKPFAIPETGAGNCNAGTDVCDDPAFPHWLADTLTKSANKGLRIAFVGIWNNNGGGNYEFSFAWDNKPNESAAWRRAFGKN